MLFDKQVEAYTSQARETFYVGGIQCGKSTVGALWMRKQMALHTQEDDSFIIAAPTYKVLSQATMRAFRKFAKGIGRYHETKAEFKIHGGGTIYVRTATDPESMEGITNVRGAWLDEAGLVSRYFWENVQGRCAFKEAPIFCTTTPYAMNWMSQTAKEIQEGKYEGKLIQLRSIDSPYFPKAEYDRQKQKLDPRRFAMKYEGQFGQMQGLVYPELNIMRSIPIPAGSVYYAGIDWGYTDPFVLVIRAVTPQGIHFRVGEFYKTGLIASEIMNIVKARHSIFHFRHVFCDPSRPEYIQELCMAGVPAVAANNDIRLGIDKHTELIRSKRFFIFEDTNPLGLDEYRTYHYPEPEELGFDDDSKEMLPVDANNHGTDCDRYISAGTVYLGSLARLTPKAPGVPSQLTEEQKLALLRKPRVYQHG